MAKEFDPLSSKRLSDIGSLAGKDSFKKGIYRRRKSWSKDDFAEDVAQNFHRHCNKHLRKIANDLLQLSYKYLGTAYFFQRSDIALPGVSAYFLKLSQEEMNNADSILKYMNLRGGDIVLYDLKAPRDWNRTDTASALTNVLEEERKVNHEILKIHRATKCKDDGHVTHYLESGIIDQKVRKIRELGEYKTQLGRLKTSDYKLGEYMFDSYLRV